MKAASKHTKYVQSAVKFMLRTILMRRSVDATRITILEHIEFFRVKRRMRTLFTIILHSVLAVVTRLKPVLLRH